MPSPSSASPDFQATMCMAKVHVGPSIAKAIINTFRNVAVVVILDRSQRSGNKLPKPEKSISGMLLFKLLPTWSEILAQLGSVFGSRSI